MRICSAFAGPWFSAAIIALTWGQCAGQSRDLSGTWRLNVEKSHWGSVSKPISVFLIIEHREPTIQYHGAVTYANEDTREFAFTGAFDGKSYRMIRSFGSGNTTLQRIDESTFHSDFRSDDGLNTEIARTSISRDGKMLTRKLTMRSSAGTKTWTEVYEKSGPF